LLGEIFSASAGIWITCEMSNELKVIDERIVLEKNFRIFGTFEEPLFLAKDVAEWIEHSNVAMMLQAVDEEEKTVIAVSVKPTDVDISNPYTQRGGTHTNQAFLTEEGLYEVLMQSRKPIAKAFKKHVKEILKTIRKTGGLLPKMGKEPALPMAVTSKRNLPLY